MLSIVPQQQNLKMHTAHSLDADEQSCMRVHGPAIRNMYRIRSCGTFTTPLGSRPRTTFVDVVFTACFCFDGIMVFDGLLFMG